VKDSLLTKFIFKNHIQLFILNVYRSNANSIGTLLNELYAKLPLELWKNLIAVGDWNINMNEDSEIKATFLRYIKSLGMKILAPTATRKEALLDFAIYGTKFDPENTECYDSASDHQIVEYTLRIQSPTKKLRFKIPNIVLGRNLTLNSFVEAKNSKQFLEKFRNIKAQCSNSLRITPRPKIFDNNLATLLLKSDLDTNL